MHKKERNQTIIITTIKRFLVISSEQFYKHVWRGSPNTCLYLIKRDTAAFSHAVLNIHFILVMSCFPSSVQSIDPDRSNPLFHDVDVISVCFQLMTTLNKDTSK